MISYINCSPRLYKANSDMFLDVVMEHVNEDFSKIYLYNLSFEDVYKKIKEAECIVFAFPLYVDAIPSRLIGLIEYMQNKNYKLYGKKIYAIVNCGFLEAKHNNVALDMLKNWCDQNYGTFLGTLSIGAGEVLGAKDSNALYQVICRNQMKNLRAFGDDINKRKSSFRETTLARIVGLKTYCICANVNWDRQMIKNNVVKK